MPACFALSAVAPILPAVVPALPCAAYSLFTYAAVPVLLQPHVDSFDYFLGEGMHHVIENMDGIEVENTLTCAG